MEESMEIKPDKQTAPLKLFYYFHGWNSAIPKRLKSDSKMRTMIKFCNYFDYEFHPTNINYQTVQYHIDNIIDEISDVEVSEVVLSGTSLGGWFARIVQLNALHLEKDIWALAFNPSLNPGNTMLQHTGVHKNYKTDEKMIWNALDCEELAISESQVDYFKAPCFTRKDDGFRAINPFMVFVEKGDELIDWEESKDQLADCSYFMAFDGGNHRFQSIEASLLEFLELKKNV